MLRRLGRLAPLAQIEARERADHTTEQDTDSACCEGDVDAVLDIVQSGDVILTLGAGDIYRTGMGLLARLQEGGLRAP